MNDLSYQRIKEGLDASAMRQRTISSNVANVNTSGYKANKVEFESELRKAMDKDAISMKATHEGHLGGSMNSSVTPKTVRNEGTTMNENGNNVDIDNEMVELASNEIYYSALIAQLNQKLGNMNYVINK
ncbi:MAG: flagellar basal body rod protein FlgB [Clostridiaceae bacterium]